ncbi:MAG TPA: thioredoxin domain-containing protein [Thermoanaerobaculia bacterium]|nr:thioredoxin domain-containing protein [Thermoanaerobaculia bacterium]
MRNLLVAAIAAFLAIPLFAASADVGTLKDYAARALPKCPDQKITLERVDKDGPIGFVPYVLTQTSSDSTCGRQTTLLYSPLSQQVLIGTVIELPQDARNADVRVAERAMEMLKTPMTANVSKFPLPDRLKATAIFKQTEYGPFAYHGFVDASERFLVIGTRGSLLMPPSKTLIDALQLQNGVRRGNPKAKAQIIELSDFECPSCRRAHMEIEPIIEKHLAKVDYYRLDLPLFEHHEWAVPAALAARALAKVAPKEYWKFADWVYKNQEEIGKRKSFDDVIREYCQDREINWPAVEKIYRSPAERAALMDQVSRGFDNGINSTPTYIVNGQIMGFGPHGSFTVKAIKDALGIK